MKNLFMALIVSVVSAMVLAPKAQAAANEGGPIVCPAGYYSVYAPFEHRYVCRPGAPSGPGSEGGR